MSKLADIQNNDQSAKNENRKMSLDKKETSKAGIEYCRGHWIRVVISWCMMECRIAKITVEQRRELLFYTF